MKLKPGIESRLKEIGINYMKQSRPGWNVPHLLAAVHYMKKLIEGEGGNPKILVSTMYLHDIGYAGMLQEGYTFDDNLKVKIEHMVKGASMAKQILTDIRDFSPDEISKICDLIENHDNLDRIEGHDIQLVFEADSLGQIDIELVPPNFDKENYDKFIDAFNKKRTPLFKTKTGINYLKILMPKAEKFSFDS